MKINKEYRTFTGALELRAEDGGDGSKRLLSARFVPYNSSAPYPGYDDVYEQVAPGCFGDSITRNDVMCLYNHNFDFVLGRNSAATFSLDDRSDGLYGVVEINDADSEAVNVYNRVQRGDIRGCSFGAYITKEDYVSMDDGSVLFVIREAELIEVSICPYPFYSDTTVEARGAGRVEETIKRRREYRDRLFNLKKKKAEEKINELKNHAS